MIPVLLPDSLTTHSKNSNRPNVFIREIRDLWNNALTLPRVIRQIVCLSAPSSSRLTNIFRTNHPVRNTILRLDSLVPPSLLYHHLYR